jgi:polysaccharide pyruvyl transferase WcaK-like protein
VEKKIKIGILGHVKGNNLGDESIIASVIENVKKRKPHADIYGFTANPTDTYARHKIVSFPIRRVQPESERTAKNEIGVTGVINEIRPLKFTHIIKNFIKKLPPIYKIIKIIIKIPKAIKEIFLESFFLIKCFQNLKEIDLLIIAGSQQLIDFIGVWIQPYTIFKWVCLSRITGTKVAFLSLGAGPISMHLGRFFIKYSLKHACYISVRDESSKKTLEDIGFKGEISVFPDLVYSLGIKFDKPSRSIQKSKPIVAINPVPFSDPLYWPGSNNETYEKYIRSLARFAEWLMQRDYSILFFPTQLSLDPPVIADIRRVMKNEFPSLDFDNKVIDWPVKSFDDLTSAILKANIVVATRFHGVVIPFILDKPVIAVAYHEKTFNLMAQMGQSEYVLDIHQCDENQLQERFTILESQETKAKIEIEQKVSIFRKALDTQYDRLVAMI